MIRVELRGGLGNQLFEFSNGLSRAIELQSDLVLDKGMLSGEGVHVFGLQPIVDLIKYPISIVDGGNKIGRRIQRRYQILSKSKTLFQENSDIDFRSSINQIRPGQLISGYFQSPSYMSEEASFQICSALEIIRNNVVIESRGYVNLHIRRGDYLHPQHASFHGITSIEYFERSIALVEKLGLGAIPRVFSDTPSSIPDSFLRKYSAELVVEDKGESALENMLKLSCCESIIISNSTFSWWSAWLLSQRDKNSVVVAPRPWFADGSSAHQLLLPDWVTLG